MHLVLASASPRRAELLRAAGFTFETCVVDIDEAARAGEPPASYVRRLAGEKSARASVAVHGPAGAEGPARAKGPVGAKGPANRLRQGYGRPPQRGCRVGDPGGPPKLYAKVEAGHYVQSHPNHPRREVCDCAHSARQARSYTCCRVLHPESDS